MAEECFADSALDSKLRWFCTKTDDTTDMVDHVDFTIAGLPENEDGVDVKAQKAAKRGRKVQDIAAWIELRSVPHNKKKTQTGWLFGKAKFIAFERATTWLVVEREKLINLVASQLTTGHDVGSSSHAIGGNLYHRRFHCKECDTKDESDVITMIHFEDIEKIAYAVFDKSPPF